MKILFIDSNHPILCETLLNAGHTCDLNYSWTKEDISNNIYQYDGIIIRSKIKITTQDKILFKKPSKFSKPIAQIKKGRLLIVQKCKNKWCKIESEDFNGWIDTIDIWGSINN